MQFSLRLKDAEKLRVDALIGSLGATRYEVVKRFFLLGLERVKIGDEPFNALAPTRLEKQIDDLIGLLRAEFTDIRARDFNVATDHLETMVWLRSLGDIQYDAARHEAHTTRTRTVSFHRRTTATGRSGAAASVAETTVSKTTPCVCSTMVDDDHRVCEGVKLKRTPCPTTRF